MPFKGNIPTIAPTLIKVWTLSQAKIPTTISLVKLFGHLSMICFNLVNKAAKSNKNILQPIKPNFSAKIAKIESLAASGRYPYA